MRPGAEPWGRQRTDRPRVRGSGRVAPVALSGAAAIAERAMSYSAPGPEPKERSLAWLRRVVLIVLGASCLGVLARMSDTPRPLGGTAASLFTPVVVLLALGAIGARQIAARRLPRQAQLRSLAAAYAFSAALGIAGLLLALATGEALQSIGCVLAGALFALPGLRAGAAPNRGSH